MEQKYPIHVILDLDETLIHSATKKHKIDNEYFHIGDDKDPIYIVYKRNGLNEFIEWLFQKFEKVSVWTAATADYAVEIIIKSKLVNESRNIEYLLVRQHVEITEKKECGSKCIDCMRDFFITDNIKGVIIVDDNELVKKANCKVPQIKCLHISPFKAKTYEDSMMTTIKPQLEEMAKGMV